MELKATLNSPWTNEERYEFIIEQNYNNGYIIKELEDNNYLVRKKIQDDKGRINYRYDIFETPQHHFGVAESFYVVLRFIDLYHFLCVIYSDHLYFE